jgi:hypothetical protein
MTDVNVPSVSDRQKKIKRNNSLFVDIWNLTEEKSRIRSRIESNVQTTRASTVYALHKINL